jgi:YHS domain-containing protein
MKRFHHPLVATFGAVFVAIVSAYIAKAENSQNLNLGIATPADDHVLLAQDTATAKKKAVKAPRVNVDRNGVILKGYDPVGYFTEHRAVKGDPKFSSKYRGATYYFASDANKSAFEKDPAKYAPQYGGFCANGMTKNKLDDIDPNVFFIYKGKLYVCQSEKAGKIFYSNPDVNIKKADANWRNYEPPSNPGFRRELGS